MTRIGIGGASPSGLRWPHYVNGRLLTAQDLQTEQDAVVGRDAWLGQAVGSGSAVGLDVTGTPGSTALKVAPGTGVTPGGTAVHLSAAATLDLTVMPSTAPVDGSMFADCRPATTETAAPTAGAYLLTMAPASSYEGKVPVAGSATATLPTPCTSRWEVEDVVFAAIRLDAFDTVTTPANRRCLLAHFCFGSAALEGLTLSGFTEPVPWRGVDGLSDATCCDLPLGVFDWDGTALTFVDRWSARRRTVRPSATVALAAVVGDERTADGEARFLQFQDQLDGLLSSAAGRSARALDVFPLLPPAGLVPFQPLAGVRLLMAEQPDFPPAPDDDEESPPVRRGGGRFLRTALTTPLNASATAAFAASRLGLVSRELVAVQEEIDALRIALDALTARVAGRKKPDGSDTDREEARRLAAAVVEALVDGAGDGVDPGRFFDGIPVRLGVVDHETVDFTIRRSWYDEAIPVGRGAVLNIFFVLSTDGGTVAPYLMFTARQWGVRWINATPKGSPR